MKLIITPEEEEILETMAADGGADVKTQKRALAVLTFIRSNDLNAAAKASALSRPTVKKILLKFEEQNWQGLLSVLSPRGGDFLARYDQGFWAERIVRGYLEGSVTQRPIPYGTSRSE